METNSPRTRSKSKWIAIVSILIIVILAILFYSPLRNSIKKTSSPTGWITYTSDKNDFTAVLPSEPQRDSLSSQDTNTNITTYSEIYSAGVKGDAYVINTITYVGPADFSNPKINLQNLIITWLAKDKDNILESLASSKSGNLDALDFHIVHGTENIQGRIIANVKDQTIYEIFADYEGQQPAASSYKIFIDGFKIK